MTSKLPNFLPQITRTVVPFVVGWLISLPLVVKVEDLFGVPQEDRTAWLARLLTVALGAVYYIVVAFLERHQSWFGWLLGVAKQPVYQAKPSADTTPANVITLPATGAHPDVAGDAEDALGMDGPDNAEDPSTVQSAPPQAP